MKTLYFPKEISGTCRSERLSISTTRLDHEGDFFHWLKSLSAPDMRVAIGMSYTDLLARSRDSMEAVSTTALKALKSAHEKGTHRNGGFRQLSLFGIESDPRQKGKNGTFSGAKHQPVSRWYPYLEGYSADFVKSYMAELSNVRSGLIFDPFCGSGTTVLAAMELGWRGAYCEINPFMTCVIDMKSAVVPTLFRRQKNIAKEAAGIAQRALEKPINHDKCLEVLSKCFPGRPYFNPKQLVEFVSIRSTIHSHCKDELMKKTLLFALACIAIDVSNLKRAGDVRYRRESEMVPDDLSVGDVFVAKANQIWDDAPIASSLYGANPKLVSPSVLDVNRNALDDLKHSIDLIITSPPYLNGTNYIRNTKLELWTMGMIGSESDMSPLRRSAITAGINDVFKDNRNVDEPQWTSEVIAQMEANPYDKRIPLMVRSYMSDAVMWLQTCTHLLKDGSHIVIDIGDSMFGGVHVPTIEWLNNVCRDSGLEVKEVREVRRRKSKDGSPLTQSVIIAAKPMQPPVRARNGSSRKPRTSNNRDSLASIAKNFAAELPYKSEPYSGRNWGNPLHSICSYQGKLKPALAHFLVQEFTRPGDVVLDPLSGAGTIPLECLLQGRTPVANDLQELAHVLSTAKCSRGSLNKVLNVLWDFVAFVEGNHTPAFSDLGHGDFGFNGKIPEYYHEKTLGEVVAGRSWVKQKLKTGSIGWAESVVIACWLHILHGNRPYALSRRSHPVTPFKPIGEFEYRDTRSRLADKVNRCLSAFEDIPEGDAPCSFLGDFCDLNLGEKADVVITSPPFANSTRFYVANWLRLWASGWEPSDFKSKPADFIETKQKKDFDVYKEFLAGCRRWLKPYGVVVMHLGKSNKSSMADEIEAIANQVDFPVIARFDECVASCEKFGVRDQGATIAHEFLVLEAN